MVFGGVADAVESRNCAAVRGDQMDLLENDKSAVF